jgi:putative transposase
MRKTILNEEQIAKALAHEAAGASIEETCRTFDISKSTFYNWRDKYFGLNADDLKLLRELEDQNRKLKKLLAVLREDHRILADLLA